ncbi:ABC transporter ATP-binding protein [Clostridium sp. D2Q-14]|uniref:ABC transporter ATP-binding protein n=1 Tax=Anaeromonas gelatinilytica TaxID=2683194 RepID=UPI00193C517B|nr:ABC transporter ATP-binding protein [Anaeromonas gelatinilytica]
MEILIDNVSKKIKNKIILQNIDIHVKENQVYGLIGPNGAGKTTLIRIILNLYQQTEGKVMVNGVNVNTNKFDKIRKDIGCLFDHLGLYKSLSAWENIEFFDRIYYPNSKRVERENRIKKVLEFVELINRKDDNIVFFSREMQQRLALARAIINKPKLLILDEPTRGLDLDIIFMLRKYIEMIKGNEVTVFICSHHLSQLEKICDVYGFIKEGELKKEGTFEELCNLDLIFSQ